MTPGPNWSTVGRLMDADFDAEIVGSGPNGLASAVVLARAGLRVRVIEAEGSPGGGLRTESLSDPEVRHDLCSAVHPQAMNSEFFRLFALERRIQWITPEVSFAHAVAPGRTVSVHRDFSKTVLELGPDGGNYCRIFGPLIENRASLIRATLGGPLGLLKHPVLTCKLGMSAARSALTMGSDDAAAVVSGLVAHVGAPKSFAAKTAAMALGASAHLGGWPIPRGGSGMIAQAMIDEIESCGGRIDVGQKVESIDDVHAPIRILNVHPQAAAHLLKKRAPEQYLRKLNAFKPGAAVIKIDFVLSEPVPWIDPSLAQTPTVHIGGSARQIHEFENAIERGQISGAPMVIAAQPSLFDQTRAPKGKHILWAYCHAPRDASESVADMIVEQLERYAPGFRDVVMSQHVTTPAGFEKHNLNYVGGDILTGAVTMRQLLARPNLSPTPWRTPVRGVWIASAGVSPGPSVHGMGGYYAALDALHRVHGIRNAPSLAPKNEVCR